MPLQECIICHLGTVRDGNEIRIAYDKERSLLAEQGFCCINPDGWGKKLQEIVNEHPWEVCDNTFLSEDSRCKELCSALYQARVAQPDAHLLYINHWACLHCLEILPLVHSMLRHVFPKADIKAFISLVRQDLLIEDYFTFSLFCGNKLPRPDGWWKFLQGKKGYNYATLLNSVFSTFGRENVECYLSDITDDTQNAVCNASLLSQEAFWRFAGVNIPPDPESGLSCFSPQINWRPGPELIDFCRICNDVLVQPYKPSASPWLEHSLCFTGDTQSGPVLGLKERIAFAAAHEKSNAEAARMLGRERLFSPLVADTEREPFADLTPHAAFSIAERLDKTFAHKLLADFGATPVHYMPREPRIVYEALNEVCAPTSTPLSRLRAEEPKLSVLTLTYNHAKFIRQCIESIIEQHVNFPLQHIIADDGSDDGTQDIILEYAAKYSHIVPVLRKDRVNTQWKNVSVLFEMARTEYVALCDGDDYFTDPDKLQIQVDFLEQHKDCALCFHVVRVTYEDHPDRERFYPRIDQLPRGVRQFYYLSDLIKCNQIQTNSVMYRWRFRDGLPDWFRADLVPGDWYWHLLHAETGKIGFINKIMSVYRRHEKGIYYLAEVAPLRHRATVGLQELATYDVVNRHFNGKYQSILMDLANGVFVDCLLHANEQPYGHEESILDGLCDAYPDFAMYFLASLKLCQKQSKK